MSKPFLTYDEQIDLLKSKHLIVADEEYAKKHCHKLATSR